MTTGSVELTLTTTTRDSDSVSAKARMSAASRSTASTWRSSASRWPWRIRLARAVELVGDERESRVRDDAGVGELRRALDERHVRDVVATDDEVVERDEAGAGQVGLLGDESVGPGTAGGDEGEAGGDGRRDRAACADEPEPGSFVRHGRSPRR